MKLPRRVLLSALLLAALAGGARAQEGAAAGSGGATLPFINEGANRPVLQTISPDGVAIAPDAMTPPPTPSPSDGAPLALPDGGPSGAVAGGEGAAHDEAGGEGHRKGLPQFDVSTFPKQFFWLAVVFTLLYVTFSRHTLPTIGAVLDGRAARVAQDLNTAQSLKFEVERLRAEYEAMIALAQGEAQTLVAASHVELKHLAEAQDAAFKTKAERAVSALEARIDTARARLTAELEAAAAELTLDIAAQIAGVRADRGAAQTIVAGLAAGGGSARAA